MDRVKVELLNPQQAHGVLSATVNLAVNRAQVRYLPAMLDTQALAQAVVGAGYGDAVPARLAVVSHWQEAMRPRAGVSPDGGTTPDRLFSLEVGRCFGACGMAPVLMVNDDLHQRVKPAKLGELLEKYRAQAAPAQEAKP